MFRPLSWVDVRDDAHVPQTDPVLRTWPFLAFGEGLLEAAGCAFSEGCLVVLWGLRSRLASVWLAGVLFFVELLLPGLAFLLCLAVRGMLIQASRRHAQCEGNSALSALWAMIWATAYTAPMGLLAPLGSPGIPNPSPEMMPTGLLRLYLTRLESRHWRYRCLGRA